MSFDTPSRSGAVRSGAQRRQKREVMSVIRKRDSAGRAAVPPFGERSSGEPYPSEWLPGPDDPVQPLVRRPAVQAAELLPVGTELDIVERERVELRRQRRPARVPACADRAPGRARDVPRQRGDFAGAASPPMKQTQVISRPYRSSSRSSAPGVSASPSSRCRWGLWHPGHPFGQPDRFSASVTSSGIS